MTPITNESISIFFPIHNEASNLETLVRSIQEIVPQLSPDVEVIIVDDGSTDGSAELADQLSAEISNIRVIHHQENKGYGGALQSGFRAASKELVFYTDGDGQFDVSALIALLPLMSAADVLTCYRMNRKDSWRRTLNTTLFEWAVRILFGLRVRDPDCAFKIYRKHVVDGLEMASNGALIDVEMLIQAQRAGCRIVQRGVEHLPRTHGESSGGNPKVIFRALGEILALWFRWGRRKTPHFS